MSNNKTTDTPSLFSDAEMDALDVHRDEGPVVCLGREFENDEARRAYFRDELRRRLPELRQIEGFPIGSDDDIIRLSDPPYYTACPNPWLNDFVREWEDEKVELEREGKRDKRFRVSEPYASDVSEGKNNPVYTAHTYHTKVPHPAIMRYILHYTQPGDVVFDGFAGTGMTGVAAAACANSGDNIARRIGKEWQAQFGCQPRWGARHAVCGDLSPYATNITYFYNTPVDVAKLKAEVERIKQEMDEECGWMYTTTNSQGQPVGRISFVVWSDIMVCPHCGEEYVFWHQAVDHEGQCMRDEFECPHCHAMQSKRTAHTAIETYFDSALNAMQKRVKSVPVIVVAKAGKEKIQREPNEYDLEVLKRIEETEIEDWYPTAALPEGLKTRDPKVKEIYYVHQFYTKRNLIALSKLYAKIEASPMAHALRFMFTGMIILSSSMNRVRVSNPYNRGKGNLSGTLYVPSVPTETSIIDQISERLRTILNSLDILSTQNRNILYVGSADNLTLADNSIDYIFTDPPFGANINYSELNSLPEPWLRVITNNGHEAIENTAQGKTKETYRNTMTHCFGEYYRVLKPGKWMTVEFSNTSAAVWNGIQNAIQSVGFVIVNVAALDKKQGSFNAVTTTTAVKQDLVITCYKPSERLVKKLEEATDKRMEATDFVEELLQHLPVHIEREQKTTAVVERSPKILYDRLISYYVQHGWAIPMDAGEFQQMLRNSFIERDGMFFTASQALQYEEQRAKTTEFVSLALIVSSEAEGIAWLNRELGKKPQTYQELQPEWMKAMVTPKKGDRLPELMEILEENFIKDDDDRWRKPDAERAADLEIMRQKKMAREFALYAEQASKPKAKRMKDCRLEVLRYGFKDCYKRKDYATIISVGDHIQESLLLEDEFLLQYYDNAAERSGME